MTVSDQQIRDAALAVWNDQGFLKTSLNRVGQAAGVGTDTILRRFGSKGGLVRSAFTTAAEEFCNDILASGDLRADLVRLVEAFRTLLRRKGRLILDFALQASHNEELAELVPAALTALNRAAAIMTEYQTKGLLRGSNPWEPLLALMAPLILPAIQSDSQRKQFPSATGNVDEFLLGWRAQVGTQTYQDTNS